MAEGEGMMKAAPPFPQLQFAAAGAVLLQSTADTITAWDVMSGRPSYTCPGRLIPGKKFVSKSDTYCGVCCA